MIYYDFFDTGLIGTLTLIADDQGLRFIDFATARRPIQLEESWQHHRPYFRETRTQLQAYFSGELTQFNLSLAPRGTTFQKRVWQALQKIPYGSVTSYGQIAEQIDAPKAVRAVGGANGRNPLPVVIPCHRVIGSNGHLTGFGGGLAVKAQLIELEKRSLARISG